MTIGQTFLKNTASNITANSYASGTMAATPTAGRVMVVTVVNAIGSGTATEPDVPTHSSVSAFAKVDTLTQSVRRVTVFMGAIDQTPSTASFDVTFGGVNQAGCNINVVEMDLDTTTPWRAANVVPYTQTSGTSFSVGMGAFASAENGTFLACGGNLSSSDDPTATGGITRLANLYSGGSPTFKLVTGFDAGNITSPGFSTTSNKAWCALGIELVAVTAGGTPLPVLTNYYERLRG